MGCNCKGTKKGIPNNENQKWLAQDLYNKYQVMIGDKSIQYFTKEQREKVLEWYYMVWFNSVDVDYKHANSKLLYLFEKYNLL